MLERGIIAKILGYLTGLPCCFAWKTHGDGFGYRGLPDIICCLDGKFVAFEVKTSTGKLTKLQEVTLAKINSANGHAHKVTSVEDVKKYIEKILEDLS